MTFSLRNGAARLTRGSRATAARAAAILHVWLAWQWAKPLARTVLGVLGLVLLAAIGRSALAGASSPALAAQPASMGGAAPPLAMTNAVGMAAPTPGRAPEAPSSPPAQPAPDVGAAGTPPFAGPATDRDASTAAAASSRRATPDDPVVLNSAGFDDLRRLPGVGPKRAEAILALRQRLGRFRQVEDLLKVKGIGRSTLRKLRPLVRIDPPARA